MFWGLLWGDGWGCQRGCGGVVVGAPSRLFWPSIGLVGAGGECCCAWSGVCCGGGCGMMAGGLSGTSWRVRRSGWSCGCGSSKRALLEHVWFSRVDVINGSVLLPGEGAQEDGNAVHSTKGKPYRPPQFLLGDHSIIRPGELFGLGSLRGYSNLRASMGRNRAARYAG